jgi:hypothetical protein
MLFSSVEEDAGAHCSETSVYIYIYQTTWTQNTLEAFRAPCQYFVLNNRDVLDTCKLKYFLGSSHFIALQLYVLEFSLQFPTCCLQ